MCDDKYSVHKMCPGVHLMCELHVRKTLYRAACSLSDADSHLFRNQNNSCSRILSNKCTIAQEYIGMNVKRGKEYLAGTLREFARNVVSNSVSKLACNLLPPRSYNIKFGTRSNEEKVYRFQKDCEVAVRLQPIKAVGEQPM